LRPFLEPEIEVLRSMDSSQQSYGETQARDSAGVAQNGARKKPRFRPVKGKLLGPRSGVSATGRLWGLAGGKAPADERTAWPRRLRDIMNALIVDQGGLEIISEARLSLIRRAATLTVELERIEARFADGTASEGYPDLYQRLSNALRRILCDLGLDRAPKDITPDLRTYLQEGQP
jgi:hypothetical protein